MKRDTKTVLIIGGLVIGAFLLFRGGGAATQTVSTVGAGSNVSVVGGQQIIAIGVKGGYQPQTSTAQAGLPTILRFQTNGTFDCSSSIRIPDLGINEDLPSTGTTDIDVGTLSVGTLQGTCAMGMYRFEVNAQ